MNKKVTIVSTSYNQEKYISQTLDSIIIQKTNFPFEVIVSDDCSTDKTPEIIREYAEKYPGIIKPIFREKNIGSISNYINTLSTVKSEYVVINEGDDYFTDELKLQKQVDFLDANPDFSICFHPVRVFFEDKSKKDKIFPSPRKRFNKTVLDFDDLLLTNFMQTNSVMYRWRFQQENFADVFPANILPCDYFLHLLHAQTGKIGFLKDVMADYRRHPGGIWWESSKDTEQFHLKNGLYELGFQLAVKTLLNKNEDKTKYNLTIQAFAKKLLKIFLTHRKFHEIETLLELYPEAIDFDVTDSNIFTLEKKLQKYKRLYLICLFTSIILLFFLILANT